MELADFVAALRKRWWVLVVLVLVGGVYGYAQVAKEDPVYRSTAKVFVSLTQGDTVAELVQGSTYTQNLVASFAELATQPIVLQPVIDDLDLDESAKSLAGSVQADALLDVVIIEISASSKDPHQAASIANAVTTQLAKTVREVTPTTTEGGPSVSMTVVSEAVPSRFAYGPNTKLAVGTPALAALLLGFVITLLAARLDTRVRSAQDFPDHPERPVLGTIGYDRRVRRDGPRVVLDHPHGALAESYRRLRTNLQFVNASASTNMIVVTSSVPGEGKSTTALGIAMAVAERRRHVLLVDADLRRPSIARLCGLEGSVGLSTLLVGEASIEDVAHPWGPVGLHVLPAGQRPPNPSQLVDSDAMESFLASARTKYDFVVLDAPPALALNDAAALATRVDGAVVVAGCRTVRRAQLVETLRSLDAIGVNVIGLVANSARVRRRDDLYGYGERTSRRRWWRRRTAAGPQPTVRPADEELAVPKSFVEDTAIGPDAVPTSHQKTDDVRALAEDTELVPDAVPTPHQHTDDDRPLDENVLVDNPLDTQHLRDDPFDRASAHAAAHRWSPDRPATSRDDS